MDPERVGVFLSEPPKSVTITPKGKLINLQDEIGISLAIPKGAAVSEAEIDIATSFSVDSEVPNDAVSVSPAYIIEASTKIEFLKNIEVKLQHMHLAKTDEKPRDLVVYMASFTPGSETSAVGKFEEMAATNVEFEGCFAVIKMRSLDSCALMVGRRKGEGSTAGKIGTLAMLCIPVVCDL